MHRQSEKTCQTAISPLHVLKYMANFGPLTDEIGSGVWGTSANFNGFRDLPSLLQRRRSPEANQTLHDVSPWAGALYIHFRGLLSPDGILPGAVFTVRPSLAFSCIGSIILHGSPAAGVSQSLRRGTRMELRNFRTGRRHLYSARRPSRWASTHIVVAQLCCARFVSRK